MTSSVKDKAHLRVVSINPKRDEPEGEIESPAVLIPDGVYQVAFQHWYTVRMFGKANKLAIVFKIVDQGPFFGAVLCRWYHVRRFIGHIGKSGRFTAGPHSDLVREYAAIVGFPARMDRIALSAYRNCVLNVEVGTVGSDSKQRDLPGAARYSVIRRLVAVAAGQAKAEAA
jgi:hypothetical protein